MSGSTRDAGHRMAVLRVAGAGAIASAAFFALCWVGAFLPVGPATHMYLELFTDAPMSSSAALGEGLVWSLAFGFVAGTLFSLLYNALGALDRR